jgi:hypothetical protein
VEKKQNKTKKQKQNIKTASACRIHNRQKRAKDPRENVLSHVPCCKFRFLCFLIFDFFLLKRGVKLRRMNTRSGNPRMTQRLCSKQRRGNESRGESPLGSTKTTRADFFDFLLKRIKCIHYQLKYTSHCNQLGHTRKLKHRRNQPRIRL